MKEHLRKFKRLVEKRFHIQRMREISQIWDCDFLLEPLCYTPEEFECKKEELGIVRSALKYGIEI